MSVRVSYSGELKVRIRIHMCKKTKKQEEECGERAIERAKSGEGISTQSEAGSVRRPSVRPLRKSSAPIEPLVLRSPFVRGAVEN